MIVQWFLPIILWAATTESFKFDIFNIFNKPSHTGSSASTQKQQTSSSSSAPTSNLTISNATVPVSTPHQSAAVHNSTEKQQTPTNILPYLPDVQNLSELDGRTASQKYLPNNLTPYQEAQLKLSNYTATDLACYIAPPSNQIIDMKKLMGLWNLVRKVDNANGTDENYVCEQIVYTATGPNTFDKIADVHFNHKWSTIKGNGTFLSPGIMILDWRSLSDNTVPHRLVYTIIGTDYNEWVVGYNCRNGRPKPEVVLETRRTKVPLSILHDAYNSITSNGLPKSDMVCQRGFANSYMSSGGRTG